MEFGEEADPDAELLARVGRGDAKAFRALVNRKLVRIHGLAFRILNDHGQAEDVAQEALLRVWRYARDWRTGEARFDTWLHRVVLNLCTDRLRKRRESLVAEPPEQIDPSPTADQRLERDADALRVRVAVANLPPRQREAVLLQTYQELSNVEAAAVMGISVEALESLLSRARRTLRSILLDANP